MASGSGCNLWMWLVGVVVRRYIDFLILLIHIYIYIGRILHSSSMVGVGLAKARPKY